MPMPNPITISAEDFDRLRPKDRVFIKYTGGFDAGEREFEVGRRSYSKKYKVESKRLHPVKDGKPITRGIAKWTLYKRDDGRVSLAHGDMGTFIHSFRFPLREVEIREIKQQLKGPFKITSEGEENIYFTDAKGSEYFFKHGGSEAFRSAFFKAISTKLSPEEVDEIEAEAFRHRNPSPITETELTRRLKF